MPSRENGSSGGVAAPPVDALSIDRECLRHSHQNLIGVFFTVPIGASLLLYILKDEIESTLILEWFALALLWTGLRLWFYLAFRRHAQGAFDPVYWGRLQSFLTIGAGFIWGVVPLVAYPADSVSEQVFIALMLGGMAAGGTFAYAAMPRTAQIYLAAACIPIAVKNLAMGSVEHFPVGIMLVIYYLMLVIITRNNARTVRSAITLSFENAALAVAMGAARDVAESAADRLRAESIEREKVRNELASIMDAQPDILYVINPQGLLIKWNSALQKMCGLAPEQMMGRPAAEFVCEEDRPVVYEGIKEVFEKGSASIEARFIRHDGALVPHLCNGAVWRDPYGEPLGFIGVGKDIAELKKAEDSLREGQARYRQLSEASFEGIVIAVDGKILDCNSAFARMFGYEPEEIIGKIPVDLSPPESQAVIMDHIRRGSEEVYDVMGRKKDGTLFPIEMQGRAILYNGQRARLTALRDISERKQREEELELFRLLVEKSGDCIFMIDDEDGCRMMYVNEAAVKHYGADREEILTWRIPDWDPNFSYEMLPQHVEDIKKLKNLTIESHHRVAGGAIVPVEISLNYILYRGRICHFGYFRNIAARKEAEEKLKAAKEAAEEANKLKDKFVSLVSHDLKTPLSSMIGFLKLVRNDYGGSADEGVKLILDRTVESGQAMVRLIEDLLTISRFKTGQLKLNRQFFDADYLGVMMAGNYAHLASQKGIEIESTIPANCRIYGDKTLLAEAVQNLVTNAIKFCKSGDRITISAGEGESPVIRVRDTGPGIPPHLLADIFKFEKKTSTRGTAGETGSGFGLPLVREIMQLHGGELSVESMPGKGCLFSLTLPYVRPKILLVDDDKNSRLLQIMQLREMKADIIEAENGRDALKMLETVRPDLIITDIQMPIMDGLELLKRIKGALETKDIPVIVQSGEFGMEMRDSIFKFGGDDFFTKKIDKAEFFPRVRRFIG